MVADLHLHSFYSDGNYTPCQVVNLAYSQKVSVLSLTDHDCIMGISEARNIASSLNISFISGVELQADLMDIPGAYIHILAYNFSNFSLMEHYLSSLRLERLDTISKYIKLLQSQGFNVDFEAIKSLSPGLHLTCSHVAAWLVKNNVYSSFQEAKNNYLLPSSINYIKRPLHYTDEIISLIKKCGGIPVLAHPYRTNFSYDQLDNFVEHLVSQGIEGIEAYYKPHIDRKDPILALAKKYGLLVTGGSDWHNYDDPLPGIEIPSGATIRIF